MKTNIWVVCYEKPNELGNYSKQLLYKASKLIVRDETMVSAVCIGNYKLDRLQSLSKYGAGKVIYSQESCSDYRQVASILFHIYQGESIKPNLIMFPASDWGKCIAADLAIRAGAGLIAECIDIEVQKERNEYQFIFTRSAVSSTFLAQIYCINTRLSICTCKENLFMESAAYPFKNICVQRWCGNNGEKTPSWHMIKSELQIYEDTNLELKNARLVFGIGRGIRDKKDLIGIKQVARKYNAAIVGTRAIVEEGILEKKWQVGQSGIGISPEVYVAIGISGATQHMVGIKNAKKIIAINTDKRAPIFSCADYCIIEDYRNIMSEL